MRPESTLLSHRSTPPWDSGKLLWSTSRSESWRRADEYNLRIQSCFSVSNKKVIKYSEAKGGGKLPVETCNKAHDWLMLLAGVMVDINANRHQVFLLTDFISQLNVAMCNHLLLHTASLSYCSIEFSILWTWKRQVEVMWINQFQVWLCFYSEVLPLFQTL